MKMKVTLLAMLFVGSVGQAHADEIVHVAPCRLLDTRPGDPLVANTALEVDVRGECGIPESATGIIFNLTVISPAGTGYGKVYGTDTAPGTAVITFNSGETVITTAAVVSLSTDNAGTGSYDPPSWGVKLMLNQAGDAVIDVTGYTTNLPTLIFVGEISLNEIVGNTRLIWFAGQPLPFSCEDPYMAPSTCDDEAYEPDSEAWVAGHIHEDRIVVDRIEPLPVL